jgi:hypothetical protein
MIGGVCQKAKPKTKYMILANHWAGRTSVTKPITPKTCGVLIYIIYIKCSNLRSRTILNVYEADGFLHKKRLGGCQPGHYQSACRVLFESF